MFKSSVQPGDLQFFAKKVPFGTNHKLIAKALEELGWKDKPQEEVDIAVLTKKVLEISNKPVSEALEQQQLDQKHGIIY